MTGHYRGELFDLLEQCRVGANHGNCRRRSVFDGHLLTCTCECHEPRTREDDQ